MPLNEKDIYSLCISSRHLNLDSSIRLSLHIAILNTLKLNSGMEQL